MIKELETITIKVDAKLYQKLIYEKEKLRTQNKILNFINGLKEVPNYKTIRKSISVIEDMLEDAEKRDVRIDQTIKERSAKEIDRLTCERNLRFLIDNIDQTECRRKDVSDLMEALQKSQESGVQDVYLNDANTIKKKLGKNIDAQDILKDFIDYPIREFPPEPKWDPKGKRWLDPISGKPLDPKKPIYLNPNPPKKKGKNKKKEPEFPDWALEREKLEKAITKLEKYLKDETLSFDIKFREECAKEIKRMIQENKYRVQIEKDQKLIDEANQGKKKK